MQANLNSEWIAFQEALIESEAMLKKSKVCANVDDTTTHRWQLILYALGIYFNDLKETFLTSFLAKICFT